MYVSISHISKSKTRISNDHWIFTASSLYKTNSRTQSCLSSTFLARFFWNPEERRKKTSFGKRKDLHFLFRTGGYLNILSKFSLLCFGSDLVFVHVFSYFLDLVVNYLCLNELKLEFLFTVFELLCRFWILNCVDDL